MHFNSASVEFCYAGGSADSADSEGRGDIKLYVPCTVQSSSLELFAMLFPRETIMAWPIRSLGWVKEFIFMIYLTSLQRWMVFRGQETVFFFKIGQLREVFQSSQQLRETASSEAQKLLEIGLCDFSQ